MKKRGAKLLCVCLCAVLVMASHVAGQPQDPVALLAANTMNLNDAKAEFKAAKTHDEKYVAARKAAAIQYSQGRLTAAQWWLRRASNHTTSLANADRNRSDFRLIRRQNPLSVSGRVWVSPSDNINGGVTSPEFQLGNFRLLFPPSALALSGYEYGGSGQLQWKVGSSDVARTDIGATGYVRSYVLSSSARETAPSVSGSDYSLAQAQVYLRHRQQLFEGFGPSTFDLSFSKLWSGGEPLHHSQSLRVSQDFQPSRFGVFSVETEITNQTAINPGQPDAVAYGLTAKNSWLDANKSRWTVRSGLRTFQAQFDTYTYDEVSASLTYQHATPIWGISVSGRIATTYRSYDEFFLSLDGRRDWKTQASATALFNQLTYFGFSPTVTLQLERNHSNVARFDTQEAGLTLGFQSRF